MSQLDMSQLENILFDFSLDGRDSDGDSLQSGIAQTSPTRNQDATPPLTHENREHDTDSGDDSDSVTQSTETFHDDDDDFFWPNSASDTTAASSVADVPIHGIPNAPNRANLVRAAFFAGATNVTIDGTHYPNGLSNQNMEDLTNRVHVPGQSVFRVVSGDSIHIHVHNSVTTDFGWTQNLGPSTQRAQGRYYSGARGVNRRNGIDGNSGNASSRVLVNAQATPSSNDGTPQSVSTARDPRLGDENFNGARNFEISGGTFMNVGGRTVIEGADIKFL